MLARGLEAILSGTGRMTLAGMCAEVERLPAALAAARPDILLLDLTPEVNFGVLSDLRRTVADCKIVLWAHDIPMELAYQALGLGISGILRNTLPADTLVACLEQVRSGGLWYEKSLTDRLFSARRVVLTKRESQLVDLLSQGMKNREIASALFISEGTVKVYLSRLFHKVGVKDRLELALFGLKNLTAHGGAEKTPRGRAGGAHGLRSLVLAKERRPAPVRTLPEGGSRPRPSA